jgi:hypothetical protein
MLTLSRTCILLLSKSIAGLWEGVKDAERCRDGVDQKGSVSSPGYNPQGFLASDLVNVRCRKPCERAILVHAFLTLEKQHMQMKRKLINKIPIILSAN